MNLTENYSRKMSEILGRKMSEILGWKISQKVPKVRIFPIKISSMENVRNLFVGKCHGKDDISDSPSRKGASRNYSIINFGAAYILMDEVNLMLVIACSGCPSDSRLAKYFSENELVEK